MTISITVIIIIITVAVSLAAFKNAEIMDKLIFYPPAVANQNEWYRFFTCGFIHADIGHLAFNMICLYSFGDAIEAAFSFIFGPGGKLLYVIMYVTSLAMCLIPTYKKNKDNYNYRSLGASGAVSAVMFAYLVVDPTSGIGFIFLPNLDIPSFIFGPLFLIITAYLDKRGGGNINHSAHLWGALYGAAFVIVLSYALHTGFNPFTHFVQSVQEYFQ